MRRLVLILLLTGCASTHQPLRILTYNIHAGKDANGVETLERVANVIKEAKADIVLLQEVDRNTTRSGNVDQLAVLTKSGAGCTEATVIDTDASDHRPLLVVVDRPPDEHAATFRGG